MTEQQKQRIEMLRMKNYYINGDLHQPVILGFKVKLASITVK